MMSALWLALLFGFCINCSQAAENFPAFAWANRIGGTNDDFGKAVAFGSNGVSYVAGTFQGTVSFGSTNLTSMGLGDIFIAAYNAEGQLLWVTQAGGSSDESPTSIASDANGNVYITGWFQNSASFGTNIVTGGSSGNIFVAKINSLGQFIWAHQATADYGSFGFGCVTDKNGDLYVTGYYFGNGSFWDGYSLGTSGQYDIFITKISAAGNILWQNRLGTFSAEDYGRTIAVDTNLNVFIGGLLNRFFFVAKYDNEGNQQWIQQVGNQFQANTGTLVPDNAGGIYFGGFLTGSANFGTHSASSGGGEDMVIGEYNASGSNLWVRTFGGTGDDEIHSLSQDKDGNLLATGFFQNTVNFAANNIVSSGGKDIFIAKFKPDGSPIWAAQFGSAGDDSGENIASDDSGAFLITGYFANTTSFGNFSLANVGANDAFFGRLPGSPLFITQPQGKTVTVGDSVSLTALTVGLSPINYQWQRNGIIIFGATNVLLTLTNLQFAQSGQYSVIASNMLGVKISSNAAVIFDMAGDADADGLPTWWELLYGLNPNDPNDANTKPFNDQLTYYQKYQFGLDPLIADTDGDGISDYDEIFGYHSNPTNTFTAGDGIADGWKKTNGLNPSIAYAGNEAGFDGVTYLQVYQYDLTHTNQLNPNIPFAAGSGLSNYELINNGQHTNKFYYDREDRLLGMESSRGISIGYQYDGNGNLLQQNVLSRASETNGLPVLWLWLNGLTNEPGIAYADSDGDNWTDYQEWFAGSYPTNSNSTPNLLGNPGINIAALTLPFTPSNFVVGVGNLDGLPGDEIVIGADGNPGTNNNYLFVLTQTATNWSRQQISVGSYGITSIAVGQPTNRPSAGIYVGLRGTNGSGQIMEFASNGGIWQSNVIAVSTNPAAFVIGVRAGNDLLASLSPTNGTDGALYSFIYSDLVWNQFLVSSNSSHRVSGTIGTVLGGISRQAGFRLLDSGGIEISDIGKEFLNNRSLIPSNSVYYSKSDKWYFTTPTSEWSPAESACESQGGFLVTISSSDENQWLHNTFPFSFHIGAYVNQVYVNGGWSFSDWHWASGSLSPYRNWASNPGGPASLWTYAPIYMGSDGGWYWERPYYDTRPGIGEFYSAGGLSILPEAAVSSRTNQNNSSLLPCFTRAQTNGFSILYACVDDKNQSGTIDAGDDFVFEELVVTTNSWTTNTLDRKTIVSQVSQHYGMTVADLTGVNSKLPFTAEPDGQIFYWMATNSSAPLQRQLFTSDYAGKSWHALGAVNMPSGGQGLAGLMVDPTNQNVCNVIFWPSQAVLPTPQPSLIETAPSAAVIPSVNTLGSNAIVTIRLWDNEGNASTPFLQYQILGASTWQNATLTALDGAAYNPAARVTALPTGNNHTLGWNALADFGANIVTNILLRASAQDFMLTGNWSSPTPFQLNTTIATVSTPTNPPVNFTGFTRILGGIGINWQSGSNALLYLQRSPALAGTYLNWVNIWTSTPPTPITGSYTDFIGTNLMEFYRMKIVSP